MIILILLVLHGIEKYINIELKCKISNLKFPCKQNPAVYNTVKIDIFEQLNFRASSIRRHICVVTFSHAYQFYFFYYDNSSLSRQIFAHPRPCAKCTKICTVQKSLRLPTVSLSQRGTMTAVNTTRDMSSSVGKFYLAFNRTTPDVPHISLPYKDQVGQGTGCRDLVKVTQQAV